MVSSECMYETILNTYSNKYEDMNLTSFTWKRVQNNQLYSALVDLLLEDQMRIEG